VGEQRLDEAVAFGKVLRRLRKEAGLTQEQLGLEADLRRTYVSILELGQQQPSLGTLFKLARALGLPASMLLAEVENELGNSKTSA
jgi:transcriptional regulator with XRE-family HTH domain